MIKNAKKSSFLAFLHLNLKFFLYLGKIVMDVHNVECEAQGEITPHPKKPTNCEVKKERKEIV